MWSNGHLKSVYFLMLCKISIEIIRKMEYYNSCEGGVFVKVCGERMRALRESMNYSQMKFAETFGIGQIGRAHV